MPLRALTLGALVAGAAALDNGLALLPPMGWRSWNAYHKDVTQEMMENVMVKMAERNRTVDGKPTSFADLGYINCGLDDFWQDCGKGEYGSFHAKDGTPLINSKFPNMTAMTEHAHKLGLKCGWYMNNCGCSEHQFKSASDIATHMKGSVKALVGYGYDGLKLDGCGEFLNLTWWAELINETGRPILIENCHWGHTTPGGLVGEDGPVFHQGEMRSLVGGPSQGDGPCSGTTMPSNCPYNFFRTSGDITNTWASMFGNLQTTRKFQGNPPLSRPGTWAYPDMMEVGKLPSSIEDRSHFGAWCVTSSPLVLGYDMMDETLTDRVWPIVSNKEAIAVNQVWAGHPGRMARGWDPADPPKPTEAQFAWAVSCDSTDKGQAGWSFSNGHIVAGDGKCAEVTSDNLITFTDCDSSKSAQTFTSGSDGSLKSGGKCLDCYDFKGPTIQLWNCNGGNNQQFSFANGTFKVGSGQCVSEKVGEPSQSTSDKMQLWTKPLSANSAAVFVINNDGSAHTATIDLAADLGITGTVQVRDIWEHKDLGSAAKTYTTDSIGSHDSRFYTMTW